MKQFLFYLTLFFAITKSSFSQNVPAWVKVSDYPEGGLIQDLASDNNGRVFALTSYIGDIYYTDNNGQSWQQVANTQSFWNILDIEVDKATGVLWVGTTGNGVLWTSNLGATWQQEYIYTNSISGMHASFYNVAVKHGSGVIVGSEGSLFPPSSMHVTTNNGSTWTTFITAPFSGTNDLRFLPNGDLLAGTENGVFKSANNGVSWSALNNGIMGQNITSLALNQANGTWYAGSDFNYITQDTTGIGVFVSMDNGANWTLSNIGISNRKIRALLVEPVTGSVYAATEGGMFLSTDNGVSWSQSNNGLGHPFMTALAHNASGVFAGSQRSGVAHLGSMSSSWVYINQGLVMNLFTDMIVGAADALFVIDGNTSGVYRQTIIGGLWEQANPAQLPGTSGRALSRDGGSLYATFIGKNGNGVHKSTDGGSTWTNISNTIPVQPANFINYNDIESGNGYVYVLATYGGTTAVAYTQEVFRSTDGGISWTAIKQVNYSQIRDLDLASDGRLFIWSIPMTITPEIEVSADGGNTFTMLGTGSVWLAENADLVVGKNDSLYIRSNNIIYKRNGINSWAALPNGGWNTSDPSWHPIEIFFDNENAIYVSCRMNGMYYSENGTAWSNITAGIPLYNTMSVGNVRLTLTDLVFDANNIPYGRSWDQEGGTARGIYSLHQTTAINASLTVKQNVNVYPSPATAYATVVVNDRSVRTVEILDGYGRTMLQRQSEDLNTLTFDVSRWPSGVYYIRAIGSTAMLLGRFTKL